MAAGADTFVSHLMLKAGFKNMLSEARYPEITLEKLQDLVPEVLLLSSEPFPFKSKHQQELQAFLPKSKVILVDGEMFSWYGSRLRYVPQYFKQLRQSEFPV
jgi:ABC-type Fe3+-hydroxamate transport system substrate-binding protein